MAEAGRGNSQRIVNVALDTGPIVRWSPEIEHERRVAVFDLLEGNHFALVGKENGPYDLRLGVEENRLIFDVRDETGAPLQKIPLPLSTFRSVVKDYFKVCGSYFEAIRHGSRAQIEALEMGRRSLHNEGSELLKERLGEKIEMDADTARRLFTLLCVLHIRS